MSFFAKGTKIDEKKYSSQVKRWELLFQGRLIPSDEAHIFELSSYTHPSSLGYSIRINSSELYKEIIKYPALEIMEGVAQIEFKDGLIFEDNKRSKTLSVETILLKRVSNLKFNVHSTLSLRLDNWTKLWSPTDHFQRIHEKLRLENPNFMLISKGAISDPSLKDRILMGLLFTFSQNYTLENSSFKDYVDNFYKLIESIQNKIMEEMSDISLTSTLTQRFEFPDEIKTACKQYLLYFTEFLEDIGIEAVSSIQEKNHVTTLLIEPQNKEEVLRNITYLLNIYLHLPNSPFAISYESTLNSNLAVQRLSSQIQYLNSQLTLANAIIQQKDNLINHQQNSIQQCQEFNSRILIEARKSDQEDGEKLIGDFVKVKDYDFGPLNLNLPELLKWLKERFRN